MEFEGQSTVPLCVRHLKQIQPRYGAGDVHQGVEPAKALQGACYQRLRRLGLTQVEREGQ